MSSYGIHDQPFGSCTNSHQQESSVPGCSKMDLWQLLILMQLSMEAVPMDSLGLAANPLADEVTTNPEVDDLVGEGLRPDQRPWTLCPNHHRQHWAFGV